MPEANLRVGFFYAWLQFDGKVPSNTHFEIHCYNLLHFFRFCSKFGVDKIFYQWNTVTRHRRHLTLINSSIKIKKLFLAVAKVSE